MEDKIYDSIISMFYLIGMLALFPVVVHSISLQDIVINGMINSGVDELSSKVIMYYFIMIITGAVGYWIRWYREPKSS